MKLTCQKCGEPIDLKTVFGANPQSTIPRGRKKLNIPFVTICDALRAYSDVGLAAQKLGCSRGYIYKVLGQHSLTPGEVIDKELVAEILRDEVKHSSKKG